MNQNRHWRGWALIAVVRNRCGHCVVARFRTAIPADAGSLAGRYCQFSFVSVISPLSLLSPWLTSTWAVRRTLRIFRRLSSVHRRSQSPNFQTKIYDALRVGFRIRLESIRCFQKACRRSCEGAYGLRCFYFCSVLLASPFLAIVGILACHQVRQSVWKREKRNGKRVLGFCPPSVALATTFLLLTTYRPRMEFAIEGERFGSGLRRRTRAIRRRRKGAQPSTQADSARRKGGKAGMSNVNQDRQGNVTVWPPVFHPFRRGKAG